MCGDKGSMELGYASAAIIIALINKLIQSDVISRSDAMGVMGDALKTMRPGAASKGVAGAIQIIEQSIVPNLRGAAPKISGATEADG
jgi:hypothetical protein